MRDLINDIERIKVLLSYNVLDTESEQFYDNLADLIAQVCDMPISLISFIDDKRQWYKAKIGINAKEMPIHHTVCQFTLKEDDILEIKDTLNDFRLKDNPNVHIENGIRYYAGVSIRTKEGFPIGTVCVADTNARSLNENQLRALKAFANVVMLHLESERMNRNLKDELNFILNTKVAEAEKQIETKDQIYTNLFLAISKSNAVVEFSVNGKIISTNDIFNKIVGYEENELIDQEHELLLFESSEGEHKEFWTKLAKGDFVTGKFKRKHKNGHEVWIQASYSPVVDETGKVIRITKIAQDITEEILAKNALERLSQQKDLFIASVSHELRTPLHAIIGFSDLLIQDEENIDKLKYLESIKKSGDTLLYLVNGILDLSKIEAGLFQFDEQIFFTRELVDVIFSMLQIKAAAKNIDFRFIVEDDVPNELIGDKNRLAQVLINILDNALKFTSEGQVDLLLSSQQTSSDEILLNIQISDTGIGIPTDKLKYIFERFTQAEENTSREYGGTGLGLNISKLLVEKQGGKITVHSEQNKGTQFKIQIPFKFSDGIQGETYKLPGTNVSRLFGRILMCEDNEMNQLLVRNMFRDTNVNLEIVSNGRQAIEKLKTESFDLIFMDIQMPELDGYQTTQIIRNELKIDVPIIALTAHSMIKEKDKCLSLGMNDYLSKPFRKQEIFTLLSKWNSQTELSSENDQTYDDFNMNYLREISGGDSNFELEMLNLFHKTLSGAQGELEEYNRNKDLELLNQLAHKLKSSFGMFGFDLTILNQLEEAKSNEKAGLISIKLDSQIKRIKNQVINIIEAK